MKRPCSSCKTRPPKKGQRWCGKCRAAWMRRYRGERDRLRHRAGFALQRGVWSLKARRLHAGQNDKQESAA